MSAPVPEVEALAWDNSYKRAINKSIDNFRMGYRSNDGIAKDIAHAILASDWLAAHTAAAVDAALLEVERSVEGMAVATQYSRDRRAGMYDAVLRIERFRIEVGEGR